MPTPAPELRLAADLQAGDRRALARALSLAERGGPQARALLAALYPASGRAHVVGITGPPGSGKSTLVARLAAALRHRGRTVGVIAVDPSSPFTGGAILGDRIRMLELSDDPGVFVRSLASRGALGGLARATADLVVVMDAAGKEVVLVETVGIGQDEVAIAAIADTVLVVGVPGLGDEVQAIKAGVLEIADVLVVNKADRDGAAQLAADLQTMLALAPPRPWPVPILQTVATADRGTAELVEAIDCHRAHLVASGEGEARRAARARAHVVEVARAAFAAALEAVVASPEWQDRLVAVAGRALDPHDVGTQLAAAAGRLLASRSPERMPPPCSPLSPPDRA